MRQAWRAWVAAGLLGCAGLAGAAEPPGLWPTLQVLQGKRFVDLTHAFNPGIPHWPGFDPETRTTTYSYTPGGGSKGAGFFAQTYTLPGQWGTHVDPPAHFIEGKLTVDQIDVREMVLPLVVLDVSRQAARDPDYQVTMDDVRASEARHGEIPAGAFVPPRPDWSKGWPEAPALRNGGAPGGAPRRKGPGGFQKYLYETRGITASGHETTDTDPGIATSKDDYALETYILARDRYQIELLANLDQVHEAGAIAIVAFPKPEGGSGFPARVFAIVP